MIAFLLYTLLFLVAVAGFTLMLHVSIQRGNWLGKWQDVLRRLDLAGKEALYRMGGGCAICFSHVIAQVSFLFYLVFFILADIWPLNVGCSILWYGIYISLCTNLNLYFITKLFHHK